MTTLSNNNAQKIRNQFEDIEKFNKVLNYLRELTGDDNDMKNIESNKEYYINILSGKTANGNPTNDKNAYYVLKQIIDTIQSMINRAEYKKMSIERKKDLYKGLFQEYKDDMINLITQSSQSQIKKYQKLWGNDNMPLTLYPTRQRSMRPASLVTGGRRKRNKTKRNNRRKTKRRN